MTRGPLRRLAGAGASGGTARRALPVLGASALALLVAAVVVAVTVHDRGSGPAAASSAYHLVDPRADPQALPAGCPVGTDFAGSRTVGPAPGTAVAPYVASRRSVLERCATAAGDLPLVAVVSLAASATPDRIAPLADGVTVAALYVRVPTPGTPPWLVPLPGVGADGYDQASGITRAYPALAAALGARADARARAAATTSAGGQTKPQLLTLAALDRAARAQLESGCACTYGLVVQAPAAALRTLGAEPGIRLVDLAPYGTQPGFTRGSPLLPSDRSEVSAGPEPTTFALG